MVPYRRALLARSSAICDSVRKGCASNTASTTTRSSCTTRPSPSWSACCVPRRTFNSVNDFRVYRPKEGDPEGELAWRPLRRGIADLHRRAEVSRKATERYLDALASVDEDTTLDDVLHRLGQPTYWHGRRVRALQPFASDDRQLIQAISRGE